MKGLHPNIQTYIHTSFRRREKESRDAEGGSAGFSKKHAILAPRRSGSAFQTHQLKANQNRKI